MGKARSKPTLWVLFSKGAKPKECIKLGFTYRTVYNYHAEWIRWVRNEVKEKMKALKILREKLKKTKKNGGVK